MDVYTIWPVEILYKQPKLYSRCIRAIIASLFDKNILIIKKKQLIIIINIIIIITVIILINYQQPEAQLGSESCSRSYWHYTRITRCRHIELLLCSTIFGFLWSCVRVFFRTTWPLALVLQTHYIAGKGFDLRWPSQLEVGSLQILEELKEFREQCYFKFKLISRNEDLLEFKWNEFPGRSAGLRPQDTSKI